MQPLILEILLTAPLAADLVRRGSQLYSERRYRRLLLHTTLGSIRLLPPLITLITLIT